MSLTLPLGNWAGWRRPIQLADITPASFPVPPSPCPPIYSFPKLGIKLDASHIGKRVALVVTKNYYGSPDVSFTVTFLEGRRKIYDPQLTLLRLEGDAVVVQHNRLGLKKFPNDSVWVTMDTINEFVATHINDLEAHAARVFI